MKPRNFLIRTVLLVLPATPLKAAVSYATYGSTLTENFNSLASSGSTPLPWADNSTIPGWYAVSRVPTPATSFTTYIVNAGGAAVGTIQSVGSSGSSDRAFGSQSHNTGASVISFGMSISNDTSGLISAFNLQYAGEQWRAIVGEGADSLTFDYQIFTAGTGSLTAASGWTSVSALTFNAPETEPSGGGSRAVNGNTIGRVQLASDVTGISWGQGQELWLRWTDSSPSGNRRAIMAIDDVAFTAIPEPAAAALGAFGALLLLARRRS